MASDPKAVNADDIYQQRQAKLFVELHLADLHALVLNPSPSLTYLTGMHFHLMERPVVAVFVPHSPVLLILPKLEAPKTRTLPFPVNVFVYSEDPVTWISAFQQAVMAGKLDEKRVGIEPNWLRLLEYGYLLEASPGTQFIPAGEVIEALRITKDQSEIQAMRRAAQIAQNALQEALNRFAPGMTERQLANELTIQLLRSGSDPKFPFSPIVAAGPNSANPHATPTNRPIQEGDLLLIDWGASTDGYVSDITRTFAIGDVAEEFQNIAQSVLQANAAGRAAALPGIAAREVDRAARAVIENAGYGEHFTHRTGHGIGMEAHEGPYIHEGNQQPLQPGMTFTIEPGIYLYGKGGVRIEDDVLITENGAESLTDLPRELIKIT